MRFDFGDAIIHINEIMEIILPIQNRRGFGFALWILQQLGDAPEEVDVVPVLQVTTFYHGEKLFYRGGCKRREKDG